MLHGSTEDIGAARSAQVRYALSSLTKETLPATLVTLEQLSSVSVEYTRYVIKCACAALLTERTEERATVAARLITAALAKSNGVTLVATAMEESPSTLTKDSLAALLATTLKLSPVQQMQMAMGLVLGGAATAKSAALELLEALPAPDGAAEADVVRAAALLSRQSALSSSHVSTKLSAVSVPLALPANTTTPRKGGCRVSVAGVLQEMGMGCVTTLADSRELLSLFPHTITELDVAEVLAFFAAAGTANTDNATYNALMLASGKTPKTLGGSSTLVNAMPLLDALSEAATPKLSWAKVIQLLDEPAGEPFRAKNVSVIFDAYHRFQDDGEYPPITLFLGCWKNASRQRSVLEYILHHPDKVNRKQLATEAPASLVPSAKPPGITAVEMDMWRSMAFMEAAVHVASRDRAFDSDVFTAAAEKLPLLFLYNLCLGNFRGTVKNLVTAKHLLHAHCPNLETVGQVIVPAAEKAGKLQTLVGLFSELTMASPTRVAEVAQLVLQCKPTVKKFLTTSNSPRLVTAIAMCMDEAGEPSEKWLQRALEGKLTHKCKPTENRVAVAMSVVEVAELLLEKQVFVSSATAALNLLLASPLKETLRAVMDCAKALLASTNSLFPEDVERDATEFFKKMYADGTIRNAALQMERLSKSSTPRDKQLYACVVGILFEESSAISCYPRKELQLFAALYGEMIAKELLPPTEQQRAWGLLLPAIAKPGNFAMEEYGIIALERIKPRLAEWPQYGRALRHVKDLDFRVPGIVAAINRGIRQEEAGKASSPTTATEERPDSPAAAQKSVLAAIDPAIVSAMGGSVSVKKKGADTASKLHSHDIGTLLTNDNITAPPPVIEQQINFLIGNTDVNNLKTNATELAQLLRPEYYQYFADYLVVKRAALEPNYHEMYIELIGELRSKALERALRSATIAAVWRLLASEKIRTDSSERILLRNLGSWLGSITLEKNIPLHKEDLDFKQLLKQGLREGKLVAGVSFMTRVMNSCVKSRFFCCPNPWTMGQLSMLLEMYTLPHLKITLRFEVELLCKTLGVTVKDVAEYMQMHPSHATTGERLMDVYKTINVEDSLDFRIGDNDSGAPLDLGISPSPAADPAAAAAMRGGTSHLQATAKPFQPKEQVVPAEVPHPNTQAIMSQLDMPVLPRVVITPETVRVGKEEAAVLGDRVVEYHLQLTALLQAVVDEACEYTTPRTARIAAHTTQSIVEKDFCRDPVPEEMLVAGEAMSRSLASSLAYVMVREELPVLLRNMVDAFVGRILSPDTPVERRDAFRDLIVASNEELCFRAMEHQAAEAAALATQKTMMQLAREKSANIANHKPLAVSQDRLVMDGLLRTMGPELLPDGPLPATHRQIYRDFFHCFPSTPFFGVCVRGLEEAVARYYAPDTNYPVLELDKIAKMDALNEAHAMLINTVRQRMESVLSIVTPQTAIYFLPIILQKLMRFAEVIDVLSKAISNAAKTAQASMANSAEVAAASLEHQRTIRINTLLQQSLVVALDACCERGGVGVQREFTRLYLHHDHCYSYPRLTTDLVRVRAIDCEALDVALSKALSTGSSSYVTFAGDLITAVIIREKLVVAKDMRHTLSTLDGIARSRTHGSGGAAAASHGHQSGPLVSPASVSVRPLCKLVPPHIKKLMVPACLAPTKESKAFQAEVEKLLTEWIEVWSRRGHRHQDDRNSSVEFVKTLQQHHMLDTTNLHSFLGLSIRFCVENYSNYMLEEERRNGVSESSSAPLVAKKPGHPPPHRDPYTPNAFTMCDGFVDLVLVLLRCCSLRVEPTRDQRAETALLRRVLEVLSRVFNAHHEYVAKSQPPVAGDLPPDTAYIPVFQQQPYVRLLSNLFILIHRLETVNSREVSDEVTIAFHGVLRALNPIDYPAFAFGWLELVSHRFLIPRFLEQPNMWRHYTELLIQGFNFISILIPNNSIAPNSLVFFKSMLKLILVLLHDYPQYLISQHYPLCDAIPLECVQMLNTVLCSFPPEQRLPESFDQVDWRDPSMVQPIETDVQEACIAETFREHGVDAALLARLDEAMEKDTTPISETLLASVLTMIVSPSSRRNLINAIVLHVALVFLRSHDNTVPVHFEQTNAMRFYAYVCTRLNTKHRYCFLCSCANHLRFPNAQTHFFAKVVLQLFRPDPTVDPAIHVSVLEQITRVVAEKTVIMQPHPWGVLNTFVELMRNPEFNFFDYPFVHAPNLESVFNKLKQTLEIRSARRSSSSGPTTTTTTATGTSGGMTATSGMSQGSTPPQQSQPQILRRP